jgi:hypothetical protein
MGEAAYGGAPSRYLPLAGPTLSLPPRPTPRDDGGPPSHPTPTLPASPPPPPLHLRHHQAMMVDQPPLTAVASELLIECHEQEPMVLHTCVPEVRVGAGCAFCVRRPCPALAPLGGCHPGFLIERHVLALVHLRSVHVSARSGCLFTESPKHTPSRSLVLCCP